MRIPRGVLFAALLSWFAVAAAAEGNAGPPSIQREIIPGSELMTARERERYRRRIRDARTAGEQSQVREQHVKQMRERARIRGLALPEPLKPGTP